MTTPAYRNFGTYLNENHHERAKEIFIRLGERLADKPLSGNAELLDVGCATGALIAHLKGQRPLWTFTGVDVSESLIDVATKQVLGARFSVGSALDLPAEWTESFDVVTCMGVIGIFGEVDAERCLENLLRCLRPRGVAYVLGHYNSYDVDVLVTHRKRVDDTMGPWESGWNVHSRMTIRRWCDRHGARVEFSDFVIPFPIPPRNDPVRTWTIEVDGETRLTNGLKLLVDLSFAEIEKI